MVNTFKNNTVGNDFGLLFNQWNICEHTVIDFNTALMEVFGLRFSINKDYKNKGLVLHMNYLKGKGYSYEQIENFFDAYHLKELVESYFEIDGEIEELLSKFYSLDRFKCNFILENGEKVNFDFTHDNNTLEHYTNALLWFFEKDYVGDVQIEYID